MAITAGLVKELRERTGAGMMECKAALVETNGDIEAAIEAMRKSGQAKAAKKAGRTAADGVIAVRVTADGKRAVLVEINSETDFVAKDANFTAFANTVAECALACDAADAEALAVQPLDSGMTVDAARAALISKIGENIQVRRLVRFDQAEGVCHHYSHGNRIGVVIELVGGDAALGRDVAMHIAASNPLCVSAEQVPAELLDKEREIFRAQAADSGKPASIMEKMVEGRIRKYLEEVTLLGQHFVKNPDQTVADLLKQAGARVVRFARLEVGEGIAKKTEDFAAEVQAQAQGR
ncbi:translation elongation factor Ts [Thiospirillum jenense]|uniref:Elongation factor Ts n=1 Tax=Thiospirillum jenense TaxID=1653858 RepID=A0A839HCK7_9GAMM|nr:translation elongation factor Ts [Thiospirillum jenense]MBB1126391.1 elongation factor Ts [Thiospirillum jenense]